MYKHAALKSLLVQHYSFKHDLSTLLTGLRHIGETYYRVAGTNHTASGKHPLAIIMQELALNNHEQLLAVVGHFVSTSNKTALYKLEQFMRKLFGTGGSEEGIEEGEIRGVDNCATIQEELTVLALEDTETHRVHTKDSTQMVEEGIEPEALAPVDSFSQIPKRIIQSSTNKFSSFQGTQGKGSFVEPACMAQEQSDCFLSQATSTSLMEVQPDRPKSTPLPFQLYPSLQTHQLHSMHVRLTLGIYRNC